MKAQRNVWGETMVDLARSDERVVVLDADLATSTQAVKVADEVPESFIMAGIAEANMVGMAAGLATVGYRPWLSTFGVFLTSRSLDQIRVSVSQTKLPVRLAASYAGVLNGSSGKTHQDLADLAVMRAMPNMTVLAPADEVEAQAMIIWAAQHDGPVYLRLARDPVEPVFGADYVFEPGAPRIVAEGTDVCLVSTGVQTSRVAAARELLAQRGISARLVHVPSLKPLDEDALVGLLEPFGHVVTVEEHSTIGGLGGLVCEVLADRPDRPLVSRIGLADSWSESAPNDFLLEKYGLSPERVADTVEGLVASVPGTATSATPVVTGAAS